MSPRARPAWLIDRFEEIVAGAALIVVVGSVCWGVATRYITETPASWASEVSALAFAWLVFMGSAAAFKYGMHMSVDLLTNLLPAPIRKTVAMLVDGLVLAFLAYTVWLSILFCIEAYGDPMPILRLPRSLIYASVGAGSLCMVFRYAGAVRRRASGA